MAEMIRLKTTKGRGYIGSRRLFWVATVSAIILVLAAVYWAFGTMNVARNATTAPATKIARGAIQVVDGDTIRTNGLTYRLVGFDTPETRDAKCPQERALGERAASRLRAIVGRSSLDLTEVRCSCLPGTHGTRSCNHGRRCGALKANGEDVGQILIREGLARPFVCGKHQCPTRQPWCAQPLGAWRLSKGGREIGAYREMADCWRARAALPDPVGATCVNR
jgi:endonuclease YncB( thermonuclease family)